MQRLPELIDPWRYAKQGRVLEGRLSLARMARLRPQVEGGSMDVHLTFGIDEQRIPYVRGRFSAQLRVGCQRCLEPMDMEIQQAFSLGIIGSEGEVSCLPGDYEPLVVEGQLRLSDMLEDELILALPLVPMHSLEACPAKAYLGQAKDQGSSPFAVLSAYSKE